MCGAVKTLGVPLCGVRRIHKAYAHMLDAPNITACTELTGAGSINSSENDHDSAPGIVAFLSSITFTSTFRHAMARC